MTRRPNIPTASKAAEAARQTLMAGVTTIRDMGGKDGIDLGLKFEQGRAVGIEGHAVKPCDDLVGLGDVTGAERALAGEDCHGVGNDQIGLPANGVEVGDALFHPQQVLTLEGGVEETVVGGM